MPQTVKDQVQSFFASLFDPKHGGIKCPEKGNSGKLLFELFVLEELSKLVDAATKRSWAAAVAEGLLDSDDDLRKAALGEQIVAESERFSVIATLSAGRRSIDKDKLVANVARKARISEEAVLELWDASQKMSAPSLKKRVLEAS